MLFLYIMSLISIIVQVIFFTLAIVLIFINESEVVSPLYPCWFVVAHFAQGCTDRTAGLFYLAELVEEYSVMAKYTISWAVILTAFLHIGLLIFDDLPFHLNALGLVQQTLHFLLLREFPVVRITSPTFITAVLTLLVHHYLAFSYFGTVYHSFNETLAYFTLCLWIVPFALFVSLSANDYVLPTMGESQPLLGDSNVLTDYLSRKSKRYSLLSFFSFAKDSILPQRSKKAF